MCGEWSGSNLGVLVDGQYHVAQFAAAIAGLLAEGYSPQWLRIYQEGSFINDREVDPKAQEIILRLASDLRGVRRVTIESRPEFLTEEKARAIRSYVREDVELEIGMGFEAQDEFVRNVCIGKNTSIEEYKEAVRIAYDHNILMLGYVMIKPPFLSEIEGIEEAIKSVKVAFDIGFDEVYVQSASIHEWSLSELLFQEGLYFPPWLWSVIEVVKRTHRLGPIKIGGLEYYPLPDTTAQNYRSLNPRKRCECTERVWASIAEYNATHDVDALDSVSCSCKTLWKKDLMPPPSPLPDRVATILNRISPEQYINRKLKKMNA